MSPLSFYKYCIPEENMRTMNHPEITNYIRHHDTQFMDTNKCGLIMEPLITKLQYVLTNQSIIQLIK